MECKCCGCHGKQISPKVKKQKTSFYMPQHFYPQARTPEDWKQALSQSGRAASSTTAKSCSIPQLISTGAWGTGTSYSNHPGWFPSIKRKQFLMKAAAWMTPTKHAGNSKPLPERCTLCNSISVKNLQEVNLQRQRIGSSHGPGEEEGAILPNGRSIGEESLKGFRHGDDDWIDLWINFIALHYTYFKVVKKKRREQYFEIYL